MSEPIGSFHLCNCAGDEPLFYQVKPVTAFLVSLATLGFYSYWWHYQNWRLLRDNAAHSISPLGRALFHPLFAYSLYDQIAVSAESLDISGGSVLRILGGLRLLTFLLTFGVFDELFPALALLLFLVSLFDLVLVQHKVNEINQMIGHSAKKPFDTLDSIILFVLSVELLAIYWASK